jgi:uncharacterized repeat protein (TIGR01451 family)
MGTPSKADAIRGASCRATALALTFCCGGWLVPSSLHAALPSPPAPVVEVLYEGPNGQLLPGLPPEVLIGEDFHFQLRVSPYPIPPYIGYGPFVELYLQYAGADCNQLPTSECDGLHFGAADAEFTTTVLPLTPCPAPPALPVVFPGPLPLCTVTPPGCPGTVPTTTACFFGALPVCATDPVAGFQKVVLPLPFGSFVPTQPPVLIDVTVHVDHFANEGFPLIVKARGGFQYGNSASGGVPSIDANCMTPWPTSPSVLIVHKQFLGPEDETATGPDFPVTYQISVDVAHNQPVGSLEVTDCFSTSLVYQSSSLAPAPGHSAPCFTWDFGNVVGAATHPDQSFTVTAHVPLDDSASLQPVLGASCKTVIDNPVTATGAWTPLDPRDKFSPVIAQADQKITAKCIALQKSVKEFHDTGAPGPTPGDTLLYSLNFEIADFDTFDDLVLDDYLADGLVLQGIPVLTLSDQLHSSQTFAITPVQSVDPGTYTCNDGTQMFKPTHLHFDISGALTAVTGDPTKRYPLGIVTGGQASVPFTSLPSGGPAVGTITFRAKIADTYLRQPVTPPNVKKDDTLPNCPVISGDLLQNTDAPALPPPGVIGAGDDDSIAKVTIVTGILKKSIVAVNFVSVPPSPPPLISPGDDVTFRLTLPIPSSDAASLSFQDFLPLPVFMVPAITFPNVPCTGPIPPGVDSAIAPGPLCSDILLKGAGDPSLTTNVPANANNVVFTYPATLDEPNNPLQNADLLFTLKASAAPYVDGLHLTNHVIESEQNSFGVTFDQTEVAELVLGEPELRIRKGVVGASDRSAVFSPQPPSPSGVVFSLPGTPGTPFTGTITSANVYPELNSDVSHVDGCDLLRFVIAVENIGSSPKGAFDVRIADLLPACLQKYPSNLSVVDGTGRPFTCNGGKVCSSLTPIFFGPGITLDDRPGIGALGPLNGPPGTNIAIVTFDATIPCGIVATGCCNNMANLRGYAGVAGGPNHVKANFSIPFPDTTMPFTDSAQVCIEPQLAKSIVATSEPSTPGNHVTLGEIVQYQMQVALPVGVSPGLTLTDNLPAGMVWMPGCKIVAAPSLAFSSAFPPLPTSPAYSQMLSLGFGTVTNPKGGLNGALLTVTCNALVLNSSANPARAVKSNSFTVTLQPSSGAVSFTSSPVSVTIVEPAGSLSKQEIPVAAPNQVGYQLSYTNTGTSTAFDVDIHDPLPAGLTVATPVVVSPSSCTVTSALPANVADVTCPNVPVGGTVTVTFTASGLLPCVTVNNQATLTYSSLPGLHGTFQNPTGAFPPGAPGSPRGKHVYSFSASLPTLHCPDLAISKTHSGNFICGPGQSGTYIITITNVGNAPSSPPETVTDVIPSGLIPASGGGGTSGWSCKLGSFGATGTPVTCTSTTPIPPGGSSTLTMTVFAGCPGEDSGPSGPTYSVVNCATVSTQPEINLANNQGCDPTTVFGDNCTQPPSGLTGWWPFDELTGPAAADISGSLPSDNGSYVGAPTPSVGEVGKGLCFDGIHDYVDVPGRPKIDFGTGSFTLDLWVKTTAGQGVETMLDKRQSSPGLLKGYSLFLYNGLVGLQMADNSGSSLSCGTSPSAACTNWVAPVGQVADGLWHLIAVTVNRGSTTGGTFYVDGRVVGTFDPTVRSLSLDNTSDLWIGASHAIAGSGVEYFPGCLDEVEIAQRALQLNEIVAIYAAGAFGKCKFIP